MLKVAVEHVEAVVILRCVGRIVRGEESTLLCKAVQQRSREVLLDLSAVEAIDAAGIGALISLQAAGVYLKLLNPSKGVEDILRVTQLESVFEVYGAPGSDETQKSGVTGGVPSSVGAD